MGLFTSYELSGWDASGRPLIAWEKEEVQDLMFDEGVDEIGCNHSNDGEYIMSFCDTSFHAYDGVSKALSGYASMHPGYLLELEYSSEADDHQLIRFKDDAVEAVDRVERYPPFTKLTHPADDTSLPVLEFRTSYTRTMVLLARPMTSAELNALEDSVASYLETHVTRSADQLIHDVLSPTGCGYWILKPERSFRI